MYRSYYGLRQKPFTKTPDPRFLYMSPGHREGLARLQYVVEEREMALLTGEIGCGKTTLSRALMDTMGEGYRFCFIFNPRMTALEFLRSIARGLEIDKPPLAKDELLQCITDALYLFYRQGVCPVLILDEAQLIPDREIFDEIRLLTNFQLDDRNLLSVIIMGQPELRGILASPVHEPLRQRLAISYHLRPLSLAETLDYLDFRIERAGGAAGLFAPDAVQLIHELSGGIPRRINILATNALLVGFHHDATIIDGSHVEEIRGELI